MKSLLSNKRIAIVSMLSLALLSTSCGSSSSGNNNKNPNNNPDDINVNDINVNDINVKDFNSDEIILSRISRNNIQQGNSNPEIESVRLSKDTVITDDNVDEIFAQGTAISIQARNTLTANTNNINGYTPYNSGVINPNLSITTYSHRSSVPSNKNMNSMDPRSNKFRTHTPIPVNPNDRRDVGKIPSNPRNPNMPRTVTPNVPGQFNQIPNMPRTVTPNVPGQFNQIPNMPRTVTPNVPGQLNPSFQGNSRFDNPYTINYDNFLYSGSELCAGCFYFVSQEISTSNSYYYSNSYNSSYNNFYNNSHNSFYNNFNNNSIESFWVQSAFTYVQTTCTSNNAYDCVSLAIPSGSYYYSTNYSYAVYSL